jgi:hypothetical protein
MNALEVDLMTDLTELHQILIDDPKYGICDHVWADIWCGAREYVITGLRCIAKQCEEFEVGTSNHIVRPGVYDASNPPEWEYQLTKIGGCNHGHIEGWISEKLVIATRPDNAEQTRSIPPIIRETVNDIA